MDATRDAINRSGTIASRRPQGLYTHTLWLLNRLFHPPAPRGVADSTSFDFEWFDFIHSFNTVFPSQLRI